MAQFPKSSLEAPTARWCGPQKSGWIPWPAPLEAEMTLKSENPAWTCHPPAPAATYNRSFVGGEGLRSRKFSWCPCLLWMALFIFPRTLITWKPAGCQSELPLGPVLTKTTQSWSEHELLVRDEGCTEEVSPPEHVKSLPNTVVSTVTLLTKLSPQIPTHIYWVPTLYWALSHPLFYFSLAVDQTRTHPFLPVTDKETDIRAGDHREEMLISGSQSLHSLYYTIAIAFWPNKPVSLILPV